jgi:hypothetical protein
MCYQAINMTLWTMALENMPEKQLQMERGPRPQGDGGSPSYQYVIKQMRGGFHIRWN